MFGAGIHSPEDRRFVGLADGVVDDILAREPTLATRVGDHRFDGRLPNLTDDGVEEYLRVLRRHSSFLASVDARALSRLTAADLQILRDGVSRRIFELADIRPQAWNPLAWNATAPIMDLITVRTSHSDVSQPLSERLAALPEFFESARHTLRNVPPLHAEFAAKRLSAFPSYLADNLGDLAQQSQVAAAVTTAEAAISEHVAWLNQTAKPSSARHAPLADIDYDEVLQHFVGWTEGADALSSAAYEDLAKVSEELASVSAKYLRASLAESDVVKRALTDIVRVSAVTEDNFLDTCATGVEAAASFTAKRSLITVPRLDVTVAPMPRGQQGLGFAYCDAPGGLAAPDLPITVFVAQPGDFADPTSLLTEYNEAMIYNLMVHEGFPGHALQLGVARRAKSPTKVRAVLPSHVFIEGWAVYAEELMARTGFSVAPEQRLSLRVQQLKMQLRTILNAIVEVGVHSQGMTLAEARALLGDKGYMSEAEVTEKIQRLQLTYGQLPSYYVGYKQVAQVVADLSERRKGWSQRQVHDTVLAQGSVPPPQLRTILGLD